ncbi:hypothetical protein ACHWQZ_G006677 [Mnemiopsis leidyi]
MSLARDLGISQVGGTKYVLSSFTQDQIKTIGEVKVALSVAGVQAQHRCIVVGSNMECDILLGMDFVNTHQLNINAKERIVSSDWGTSKFLSSEPTPIVNRIKVRTDETTTVPPNSVMFVKVFLEDQRIADKYKVLSGHFEPYGAVAGLFTAEAICYSEDRKIPVRFLNITDQPIVLYKRKLLGFLDPPVQESQAVKSVKVVRRIVAGTEKQRSDKENHKGLADCWTKDRLFKELQIDKIEASIEEKKQLKNILWKHREVFSKHEFDLGTCNFFKARINLKKDAEPQYVAPLPTYTLQAAGCAATTSGWVDRSRDKMSGAKLFSTFDLSKSFYQVDYDQESVGLTAFTANGKRYVFKKLVMGHLSSSSQFARMSELLKKKVEFVGLTISEEGISVNDQRVTAVKKIPAPRTLRECQKVMGFLNYNRKFVKGFAGLAKPIYQLIDKKRKFIWTRECQEGFDEIKRRIAEGITLAIPRVDDPDNTYVVTTDASEQGFGAELAQWQDKELRTVAYFSKRVPNHKRKWSQHKLEFECLVESLLHFSLYLKESDKGETVPDDKQPSEKPETVELGSCNDNADVMIDEAFLTAKWDYPIDLSSIAIKQPCVCDTNLLDQQEPEIVRLLDCSP